MKASLRPYHILLLLVASASMLSLWKINKRSFYFHYFKVIEEVESRNSQALSTTIPNYFASVGRSIVRTAIPFLGFFLGFASLLSFRLRLTTGYQSSQVVISPYRYFAYRCIPIRAP
ncbi:MAG: hypothetical protein AAF927_00465 [Bacteroidota bacterium]